MELHPFESTVYRLLQFLILQEYDLSASYSTGLEQIMANVETDI
jgi:hypothetical protein